MKRVIILCIGLIWCLSSYTQTFTQGDLTYNIINAVDKKVSVKAKDRNIFGNIVIPTEVTENEITYSITTISANAFSNCSNVTSIVIPTSVTNIETSAFYNCWNLTPFVIPESVTNIGSEAFYNCVKFESISIPKNIISVGLYAFYGTTWYNNQPFGVIYIDKVLYQYKGTIPENTSIHISEGTTVIANSAFYPHHTNPGLTSITIPSSVTHIGDYSFYNTGLESVTILSDVVNVGNSAFSYCKNLTSMIVSSIDPSIATYGSNIFFGTDVSKCTLYIPKGTLTAYQSSSVWKNFILKESDETNIYNIKVEDFNVYSDNGKLYVKSDIAENIDIYSITGMKYTFNVNVGLNEFTLPKGIYIVKGKKIIVQ